MLFGGIVLHHVILIWDYFSDEHMLLECYTKYGND